MTSHSAFAKWDERASTRKVSCRSLETDILENEDSLRDLSRMWYQHDGVPAHKSAQAYTFLAQIFDTRMIDCEGQEVAEATGGVSDVGLVLHFCGWQSF
ncbi:uncharacterized protein TNCV_34811 [Trichonephila clavipes]|nr:uncharacterized protein TNCV_34811 [Trichonephila clavipes]